MAIDLSRTIAAEVGTPRFYLEKAREVALSRELFAGEPLIAGGLRIVAERDACLGHGIAHVEKVAVDSGALILIEEGGTAPDARIRRLVLLAQLAGILHDIRRSETDHAERGAEEAQALLAGFSIGDDERAGIVNAIRNHEAFRPCRALADRGAKLLSDALYDADKFRWGPDNFTHTLWHMVNHQGITPQELIDKFPWGMTGILNIADTFRTPTGRQFGPDIIEAGVAIGKEIFHYLLHHYRQNTHD